LRGLESVEGYGELLNTFEREISTSEDPVELEDGAVLIGYALGGSWRGLLNVDLSTIEGWRVALEAQIDRLLAAQASSPNRICALLFVKGFLSLHESFGRAGLRYQCQQGPLKASTFLHQPERRIFVAFPKASYPSVLRNLYAQSQVAQFLSCGKPTATGTSAGDF
jgi:hypothetical protein